MQGPKELGSVGIGGSGQQHLQHVKSYVTQTAEGLHSYTGASGREHRGLLAHVMGAQFHHHRHADQASGDGQGEPTPSPRALLIPGRTPATLGKDIPLLLSALIPQLPISIASDPFTNPGGTLSQSFLRHGILFPWPPHLIMGAVPGSVHRRNVTSTGQQSAPLAINTLLLTRWLSTTCPSISCVNSKSQMPG